MFEALSSRLNVPLKNRVLSIIAISGPQGSGKSTLAGGLARHLGGEGLSAVVLSIDDLYFTKSERLKLAKTVHPLFKTRGVPGTHDIELGNSILDALPEASEETPVLLPRFDKAADDRAPIDHWQKMTAPPHLIILEGWCVGLPAEENRTLLSPINTLEAQEDPDCVWRQYVNAQLAGPYADFFARIDHLIYLQIPSFDHVFRWRSWQEQKLTTSDAHQKRMSPEDLIRFIDHYERLTKHGMRTLPKIADTLIKVQDDHSMQISDVQLPHP
ncbi:kinase [Kordiimonas sediminis]|uniref:kinase n=1 Tax=Kordiimonas sediminis TaxID=1735581 RepID=UPI00174952C6|nr:kinase [Kordiimonas sediminis]